MTNLTVRNNNLDIDSNDVYDCQEESTLRGWRVGVAVTLNEIIEKLNKAKRVKAETGVHMDRDWYQRTDKARRLQEILLFQIEEQLSIILNKE